MSQIRLSYVQLKNFKKHQELEVEFGDSLTVIKGPNYAGKSSVFQAVYFALFGTKAVPGGKSVIVRNGAKSCLVVLQFMIGERNFIIERGLTSASLHEQVQDESGNWTDTLIATGPSTVTEWAEANLGQNAQQYLLLTYSRQGTAAGLLDFGAPALNRVIEALANADHVERVIVASGKRAQQAAAVLTALGPAEDLPSLRASYTEAQRVEAGVQMRLGQQRAIEDRLRTAEETALSALQQAQTSAQKHREAVALRERLAASIEAFSDEREALAGVWAGTEELDLGAHADAVEQARTIYEQMVQYKASYDAAKAELARQKATVAKLDFSAMAAGIKDQYQALKQKADKAFSAQVEIETEYNDVLGLLKNAEREFKSAVCSACKRPFDQAHTDRVGKEVERLQKQINKLIPKLEEVRKETEESTSALSKLKLPPVGWEEKWEEAKEKLQVLEDEFREAEEATDQEIQALRNDYQNEQAAFQNAKSKNELRKKELARAKELDAKIKESQDRLDQISQSLEGYEEQDLDALQLAYQKAREDLRKASDARQTLEREHAGVGAQLQTLAGEMERAERAAARRRDAERDLDRFQRLQKWLRDSKATFLGQIWDNVLSITSSFARAATFGAIEEVTRSPEGDFSYREGGAELPIEAASGGQRAIIGIGLRLALASLLPQGAGLLVLDEPSAELNDEHAAALAGTLKAQGIQILLVTHREGEEFAADKTVVLGE